MEKHRLCAIHVSFSSVSGSTRQIIETRYDSRSNKNWPKMHHCVLLKVSIVFPSFHPSLFARSPKVSLTFIPQIGIGKRQIVSERRVLLPPLLEKIVKGKKVFANNNYIQKLRQYQLWSLILN